jgi:hypothetical protein
MKVSSKHLVAIVGFALTFPVASMATSGINHSNSSKSRAEVMAELEAARKDGSLRAMQSDSGYDPFPYPSSSFKSSRTRAEVVAELEAARKDGSWRAIQSDSGYDPFPYPSSSFKSTKTREQVRLEVLNMTAAEKAALNRSNQGG